MRALMKREVYVLHPHASALDALRLFSEKGISGAPVIAEDGRLLGFLSDGDIIGMLSRQK